MFHFTPSPIGRPMQKKTPLFSLACFLIFMSSPLLTGQDIASGPWGELVQIGSELRLTSIGDELCRLVMQEDEGQDGDHHHGLKAGRTDTHAPAGLMGDHAHRKGEKMVEYKYMNMSMGGSRTGNTGLTTGAARMFDGNMFMVVPEAMNMEMHMFHFMWAPSDEVTLYVMPMWVVNTMDHTLFSMGGGTSTFRKTNAGFSDLPFGGLWKVREDETSEMIFNIGFSAPTGDIDNTTPNAMGALGEFPYPMRLGKGSWTARPGITWKSYTDTGVRGIQLQSDIVLGANDEGYSVSDEYRADAWISRLLDEERRTALTFRAEALWKSNFRGVDADLNPGMAPTARADYRGGEWINLGYGLIHSLKDGSRLNFEILHPVYQHLEGVQLETDWSLSASWSKAF